MTIGATRTGLRVLFSALVGCVSSILDVLLVCCALVFVFALGGVQLFSGDLHQICMKAPELDANLSAAELAAANSSWFHNTSNYYPFYN